MGPLQLIKIVTTAWYIFCDGANLSADEVALLAHLGDGMTIKAHKGDENADKLPESDQAVLVKTPSGRV